MRAAALALLLALAPCTARAAVPYTFEWPASRAGSAPFRAGVAEFAEPAGEPGARPADAPAAPSLRPPVAPPLTRGTPARFLLAEVAAVGVSSIGFAPNGGRIKGVAFGVAGALVLRDMLEVRPASVTRGHAATILGLAALAVADFAMEREGTERATIVLVDFAALNAIALAARAGSGR